MMASSEKVDSGKFCGGRSNFSQTCSLLSQYLNEKGGFGDRLNLSLAPNPNFAQTKAGTTLNLFPKIEQLDEEKSENMMKENMGVKAEKESGQMTIFYGGQVIVFDDFPADKANEIMTLASKCAAPPSPASAPQHMAQKPPESAPTTPNISGCHPPLPAIASDLPIARKNSLARFLEKRKDRITANAPYQTSKAVPKTEEWLELGSRFPLQIQHH